MVTTLIMTAMTKIFGSRNDRLVKTYRRRVEIINSLEPSIRKQTDAELKARSQELAAKLRKAK